MESQMLVDVQKVTETAAKGQNENVCDALQVKGLGTTDCRTTGLELSEVSEAVPDGENNEREQKEDRPTPRKRHRRGSKKNRPRKPRQKYKPYNKLTWDEKRKLDELDAVKAVKRREELVLQKGRAIAPYNTTQFLMEEHDPDLANSGTANVDNHMEHNDSSSSYSSDEYFEKDFQDFYEKVHIDTLNSYTKEDLIKNVYELEERIEHLEKDAKSKDVLVEENKRLMLENERLKKTQGNITTNGDDDSITSS